MDRHGDHLHQRSGGPKRQRGCASWGRSIAYLGKTAPAGDPLFKGRMAEVRIWTVCRSAEIRHDAVAAYWQRKPA